MEGRAHQPTSGKWGFLNGVRFGELRVGSKEMGRGERDGEERERVRGAREGGAREPERGGGGMKTGAAV